jgi:general secretion pathway protein B
MSYILDALKKSEQERGTGKVPGVQTVHTSSLNYRSEKNTYWPYILIAAVILNLLAILYFIVDKDKVSADISEKSAQQTLASNEERPPVSDKLSEQASIAGHAAIQEDDISQPTTSLPQAVDQHPADSMVTSDMVSTDNDSAPSQQKAEITNTVTSSAPKESNELVEFYDLPEATRIQLPAIVISAHVYSTNPLQRSIVINDKFMEEGEYVIDDLILLEITPDGAIFGYQGLRFHHGVVSSWQ